MYSRSTHRRVYSPPPGYRGNAFEGKHHFPAQVLDVPPREDIPPSCGSCKGKEERHEDACVLCEKTVARIEEKCEEKSEEKCEEKSPIRALLESLQGKIGEEELILLLVLLMVCSEGIGAEGLILVLVLLAGRSG